MVEVLKIKKHSHPAGVNDTTIENGGISAVASSASVGLAVGAAIGSVVGPEGLVAGAVIGGAVGAIAGIGATQTIDENTPLKKNP
jgi:hypothetical protein